MASGFTQLLKAFGIDFDPEEIKREALKFQQIMLDIDARLAQLQAQNRALAHHLGMEVDNDGSGQSAGSGQTGNRPLAGTNTIETKANIGTTGAGN